MSLRHVRTAALAIAGVIAGATVAGAQTPLRWAHVYESASNYHQWAEWAAEQVAERTDGRVTVEVFPASSLGKEVDINEGLGLGTVDIIYTGQLFAGRSYGPIAIGGAPFMFRDLEHWQKFRESSLFRDMADAYEDETGHHVVTLTYYGARHVTANKPILQPSDMEGLKIRVPNAPLYTMFPEAVNANATPMAFAEVYLALQQGVVDAQENPLPTIQFKKFYEVQSDINLTGHITDALLTIVSGDTLAGMDDGDREILLEVLQEAADNCGDEIVQAEIDLVSWFRNEGVNVNDVDRNPFIEAVKPLHNGPAATWDQATYDALQAIE